MINNHHDRVLQASVEEVGRLLDGLGTTDDVLWPSDRWPSLRMSGPVPPGTPAGHGFVRYIVSHVEPGRTLRCEFDPSIGLTGSHEFAVVECGQGSLLSHTLIAAPKGLMRLGWPLVVGPLHDALIEDLLDNSSAIVSGNPVVRRPLSPANRARRWAIRQLMAQPAARPGGWSTGVGYATSAVLAAIGGVHVMWAAGSTWPRQSTKALAELVVGVSEFPPAWMSYVVGALLFAAAYLVAQCRARRPKVRRGIARLVTYVVVVILGLRGAGGLVASTLSSSTLPFRTADLLVYSPLCLALAVAAWLTASASR